MGDQVIEVDPHEVLGEEFTKKLMLALLRGAGEQGLSKEEIHAAVSDWTGEELVRQTLVQGIMNETIIITHQPGSKYEDERFLFKTTLEPTGS